MRPIKLYKEKTVALPLFLCKIFPSRSIQQKYQDMVDLLDSHLFHMFVLVLLQSYLLLLTQRERAKTYLVNLARAIWRNKVYWIQYLLWGHHVWHTVSVVETLCKLQHSINTTKKLVGKLERYVILLHFESV